MKELKIENLNLVKNKQRRKNLLEKQKIKKSKLKIKSKKDKQNESKQEPITQERIRVLAHDYQINQNEDLNLEESMDEFQPFILCEKQPKILLTTCLYPTQISFQFLSELKLVFPNSFFYPRKKEKLSEISKYALERNFTHILMINEHNKQPYSLSFCVLPNGGTFEYRVKNYVPTFEIYNKGKPTGFSPELILKNFNTALGRRVARGLTSLFDNWPEFQGRTVVTFHNQRDFIFFRHHWYIFKAEDNEDKEEQKKDLKVNLQEIGPWFVLQLQKSITKPFDEFKGEYEYIYKPDKYVKRNFYYL